MNGNLHASSSDLNPPAFTIGVYDTNQGSDQGKDRLMNLFNQPHLFSADGEIGAGLSIDVKIGFDTPLGFAGIEHNFPIAQVTLVNYPPGSYLGEGPPPVDLASFDKNTGVLTLNVAGVAGYLQGKDAKTETFEVKQVKGKNGLETQVSGLGYSQTFSGVKSIVADGTGVQMNQDITIAENVNVPATLTGGSGKNFLTGGAGTDVLIGGFKWTEGDGPLTVTGGGSGDNILIVNDTTAGAQMSITQDKNGDGGFIVQTGGNAVKAAQVQAVNMDDLGGGGRYTVNDLSNTPIQLMGVNLHEGTADDPNPDTITVNGPAGNRLGRTFPLLRKPVARPRRPRQRYHRERRRRHHRRRPDLRPRCIPGPALCGRGQGTQSDHVR